MDKRLGIAALGLLGGTVAVLVLIWSELTSVRDAVRAIPPPPVTDPCTTLDIACQGLAIERLPVGAAHLLTPCAERRFEARDAALCAKRLTSIGALQGKLRETVSAGREALKEIEARLAGGVYGTGRPVPSSAPRPTK